MQQHTTPIRQKQYQNKIEIRKNRLDTFFAQRRHQNSHLIQATTEHLQKTNTPNANYDKQYIYQLLEQLKVIPHNHETLLYAVYPLLSSVSPATSELSSIFVNLLFIYINQNASRVAYQILCDWISNPQISTYVFINQLFKDLPQHDPTSQFESYNIHIFKILSQNLSSLTADTKFLTMSYRLLQNLLVRWSLNQEPLYLIFIINLLRNDISTGSVLLLVEQNTNVFLKIVQLLKSPDTTIQNKLLYSTLTELLFYNGEEIIITLLFSGYSQAVRVLLSSQKLVVYGLNCLESILELPEQQDLQKIIAQNQYIQILNSLIERYLYNQLIIDRSIEDALVKCILCDVKYDIRFQISRFMPGCVGRLMNPSLRLQVLLLVKRQMQKEPDVVVQQLQFFMGRVALEKIGEEQKHDYSRDVALQILQVMSHKMDQEIE